MQRRRTATARLYLAVGCGAAIGSLLRFLAGIMSAETLGLGEFAGTAFVNVMGSFAITLFATLTAHDGRLPMGPAGRQFVMAGLCGGFTTFSAMSLDTFVLLLQGHAGLAASHLLAVVGLSLAAAWAGHALAGRINR